MKGIELLPFLTEKQKELLKTSDMQYKRYARIFISIVGFDNNTVTVKVAQKENDAQKYLSLPQCTLPLIYVHQDDSAQHLLQRQHPATAAWKSTENLTVPPPLYPAA